MVTVIPPRPSSYTPAGVAPGARTLFVPIDRPLLPGKPRMLVVHTNAASGVGTIESHMNWALAAPGKNTIAHYQHDIDGDAAKMLATNRRGIANATVDAYEDGRGDASWWTLAYETADLGWGAGDPGEANVFDPRQAASLARDLAYEAILADIPLVRPTSLDGRGVITHTFPWPYPYFTVVNGKTCPGRAKKAQTYDLIVPMAADIASAWTTGDLPKPTPVPIAPNAPVEVWSTLKVGSSGERVVRYQYALTAHKGPFPGGADGNYGEVTKLVTHAWQQDMGLRSTGEADFATARSLGFNALDPTAVVTPPVIVVPPPVPPPTEPVDAELPAEVLAEGKLVRVGRGQAPAGVIGIAWPEMSFAARLARVAQLVTDNHPEPFTVGERLFVRR